MTSNNTLLIDMGNSRIKVSHAEHPATLIFICKDIASLCDWLVTQVVSKVFCASVRQPSSLKPLIDFCHDHSIALHIVETDKTFDGLINSYADVSTMGVDRWLSMVACNHMGNLPFAVLMFGTAITCDMVSDGQHLGGWIIPGRQLMQDALTQNTARVFAEGSNASSIGLGTSTPECVDMGCYAAASGAILVAKQYLSSQFEQYCIFLTGGDDNLLTSQKGDAIFRVENLVLQGLSRYAKKLCLDENPAD